MCPLGRDSTSSMNSCRSVTSVPVLQPDSTANRTTVRALLPDIRITLTALDNDLTIESIDLAGERITEFYAELPIDITVEGDYHKIGSFVSGVANLSRIVTLHDFNISPSKSSQILKMNIRAKTYRYLEDEEG